MRTNMGDYALTLLAAAAVTYLLTPLVRRFASAIGASHAARDRDVHVVPTPLLGGLAMYAGLAVGLLVASQLPGLGSVFTDTNMAKGLLMAGGLLVIMGFVDDRWGMGAISKLAGQAAAGVILVWSGAAVTWIPEPGGYTLSLSSDYQTTVTILVVVITINAVNFIDGLDGLAAGVVGIGAVAFFIYYYTLTDRLDLMEQTGPALASAVLAGMCLGFLPHNFHPAKIFMGDTGSMLIGLLLAYAPISSLAMLDPQSLTDQAAHAGGAPNRFPAILPLLLPAVILLIPYADLLLAVVRRTRAGMSPFAPDKKHLHHRLLGIGHSHRTTVLIMYLWAALFAGSVVWLSIVRTPLPVLVGVTVACVLALLLLSMPRLRPWARGAEALADGEAVAPAPSTASRSRRRARRGRRRAAQEKPGADPDRTPRTRVGEPVAWTMAGPTSGGPAAGPAGGPDVAERRPLPRMYPAPPPPGSAHQSPESLLGPIPAPHASAGWAASSQPAAPSRPQSRPAPPARPTASARPAAPSGPASPPWQPAAPPPSWPPVPDLPPEAPPGRRGERSN